MQRRRTDSRRRGGGRGGRGGWERQRQTTTQKMNAHSPIPLARKRRTKTYRRVVSERCSVARGRKRRRTRRKKPTKETPAPACAWAPKATPCCLCLLACAQGLPGSPRSVPRSLLRSTAPRPPGPTPVLPSSPPPRPNPAHPPTRRPPRPPRPGAPDLRHRLVLPRRGGPPFVHPRVRMPRVAGCAIQYNCSIKLALLRPVWVFLNQLLTVNTVDLVYSFLHGQLHGSFEKMFFYWKSWNLLRFVRTSLYD